MLEDPREREMLVAHARNEVRAENRDLQRELQLTDAEFAQVIERLAELELQIAAVYNRTDSIGEETLSETQALRDQFAQDLPTLLGHEKAGQYAAFEDTRQVRTQVRALDGRLSEGDALTDEQNRRLIAALQEQRVKFNDEMKQRVPSERVIASTGTWDGALVLADSTSQLSAHQQILQHLEEFRKRQRQAAAAVLNARQLRVFDQMQEEQLTSERVTTRTRTLTDEGD
jgi:uncharacterized protein YdcH (DUF465 family)